MDNLISFCLLPTTGEFYAVDNLQLNKYIYGFNGEIEVDGTRYILKGYKNSVEIYTNGGYGNRFEILSYIKQNNSIYKSTIDETKNILKLFKPKIKEHINRKMKWEQENKIYISI